jgi:hypothetical protein
VSDKVSRLLCALVCGDVIVAAAQRAAKVDLAQFVSSAT